MNKMNGMLAAGLVLALVLLAGCGGGDTQAKMLRESNETNLQRMTNLYSMYQSQNRWAGPPDEAEFKAFLKELEPATLQKMGIEPGSIDNVFISERDGEAFTIRYGVQGNPRGGRVPVVFEKTGKKGMRLVGFTPMHQEEVDNTRYQQLLEGQGSTAPASGGGGPVNR